MDNAGLFKSTIPTDQIRRWFYSFCSPTPWIRATHCRTCFLSWTNSALNQLDVNCYTLLRKRWLQNTAHHLIGSHTKLSYDTFYWFRLGEIIGKFLLGANASCWGTWVNKSVLGHMYHYVSWEINWIGPHAANWMESRKWPDVCWTMTG